MYQALNKAQLAAVLNTTFDSFAANIKKQNNMYRLPINTVPTLDNLTKPNGDPETSIDRMSGFLKTMQDEVSEGNEIRQKMGILTAVGEGKLQALEVTEQDSDAWKKLVAFAELAKTNPEEARKDLLVDLADWFSDIIVYCRSEAMKYGLPLEDTQQVVMGSNFTKLPADGIPVHDANGKFLKDMTNFVPPENAIKTILFGLAPEANAGTEGTETANT